MKARRKSDGKIIEVEESCAYDGELGYWDSKNNDFYYPNDLDFLPSDLDFLPETRKEAKENANAFASEPAVIEGWVARDSDGDFYFYDHKPVRDEEDMDFVEQNGDAWFLHKGLNLPSVTWQSEPKRVRITIEEIE